jgi:hypothetical protein
MLELRIVLISGDLLICECICLCLFDTVIAVHGYEQDYNIENFGTHAFYDSINYWLIIKKTESVGLLFKHIFSKQVISYAKK